MRNLKLLSLLLGSAFITSTSANIHGFHPTKHSHTEEYLHKIREKYSAKGEDHLYIHLIPHTHDDVGWLKTVDMYYTGTNNGVQQAEVHLVLDTTIQELLKDPTKKFTYVEMKFFSMWWAYQTEELKGQVRTLVQEGRLEFVNAGWSMNDEACTHYEDIINNMMVGHQFLIDEFGVKPRIGWHVDPFGHSNGNPRLFAEMGLDAWFFARIDYQDKAKRLEEQSLQWIWRPFYDHLGESVEIFTGTMQDHYCWPTGFWYDERFMGDDPVVTNPDLTTFNADEKIFEMYDYAARQLAPHYRGNHVLIPMGCDFSYANAHINFQSMDRLISYFNSHISNATVLYSTPSEYLDALISQNLTWPVKYDDMFPYADQEQDYWTGYFTSRANAKRQVRDGQANLHASSKLYGKKVIDQSTTAEQVENILKTEHTMLDAMGVYQHHDGISGTAKQYVADDYTFMLYKAVEANNAEQISIVNDYLSNYGYSSDSWTWCSKMNGTYLDCPIAQHQKNAHIVAAYNPSLIDQPYLKLKVSHGHYAVYKINQETGILEVVKAAVFCSNRKVENGDNVDDCELHIDAALASDTLSFLLIQYNLKQDLTVQGDSSSKTPSIGSDFETIKYKGWDKNHGALFQIDKLSLSEDRFTVGFDLRYYQANNGGDGYPNTDNCPSGAYIFKPAKEAMDSIRYAQVTSVTKFDAGFVQELHLTLADSSDASQSAFVRIRATQSQPASSWEVTLSGIPDGEGKEVTVNWISLDIDNADTFYTDSNGLEMQKRVMNQRPTFDLDTKEYVSGNYYPINSAIAIVDEDKNFQMTIMNDRSQGGSVVEKGRIELMQNRRLHSDDNRGVEEPLNEKDQYGNGITVAATYQLHVFNKAEEQSFQRLAQLQNDEPVQVFFAFNFDTNGVSSKTQTKFGGNFLSQYLSLDSSQQVPVKYALFPLAQNKVSLRIENIGDKFDIEEQTVYVKVKDFAQSLWISVNGDESTLNNINIVETTLTGNQAFSDAKATKTKWLTEEDGAVPPAYPVDKANFEVALQQQRIRMFTIEFMPLIAAVAQEIMQ